MGLKSMLFPKKQSKRYGILSFADGTAIPLSSVEDNVFSKGILGAGIAVIPTSSTVFAPADCTVDSVFDTGHAISVTTDFGAELLIHCGIDTVKLSGKGFTPIVKNGERVKAGDPILKIDIPVIKEAGFSVTTPLIILNSDRFTVTDSASGDVKRSEPLLTLEEISGKR